MEQDPVTLATLLTLDRLRDGNLAEILAHYDALMMAHHPEHRPSGASPQILAQYALTDYDGKLHSAVGEAIRAHTTDPER